MRITIEPFKDGATNMMRDAELLTAAEFGESAARVYSWDGAWVSLGRFQNPAKALLDPEAVGWVMRPTGGKAVLHGHDVTVGMAFDLRDIGVSESEARRVSTVYRRAVAPLVEALTNSGLPAVLAEGTEHVRNAGHTADCFAHVSPNDIVDPVLGTKVCGCALRVTQDAVLLQASIPVDEPLIDPAKVFASPHAFSGRRELDLERLASELRAATTQAVAVGV